jgi:hypothetical protein
MYKRYTYINYWQDSAPPTISWSYMFDSHFVPISDKSQSASPVHIKSLLEYNTAHFIILSVERICFARDLHHFVLCLA